MLPSPPSPTVRRRRGPGMVLVAVLFVGLAACSGSSDDSSKPPPPAAGASCPFTGQTTPLNTESDQVEAVTLEAVKAARDDCIDSFRFDLSKGGNNWAVGYASGPITDAAGAEIPLSAPVTLVVSMNSTSYDGATGNEPVPIPTEGLQFVTSVQVVRGGGGFLQVLIGLEEQRQFVASSSDDPGSISLSIG